jgi:hypothetical protein
MCRILEKQKKTINKLQTEVNTTTTNMTYYYGFYINERDASCKKEHEVLFISDLNIHSSKKYIERTFYIWP